MIGLHLIYYYTRKPVQLAVGMIRSARLRKFFAKCDHWVRIKCKQENVIAERGGIRFNLDLSQLIDNQIFFESTWEPNTQRLFERLVRPDMTVMDIGANVGAHTLALARLVGANGRVYALEPTDWAFRRLTTNLAANPRFSQIVAASQLALTDRTSGLQNYSFRAQWKKQGAYVEDEVGVADFVTLDDFAKAEKLERMDFIKLDVDGFETKILAGAKRTLERYQPILLVEMSDFFQRRAGNSAQELIGILEQHGYDFYREDLTRVDGPLLAVIGGLKDWETINIACIPSGRGPSVPPAS